MKRMMKRFWKKETATPSIETVAIVAFIALAIFTNLGDLGKAVGDVFDYVKDELTNQISATNRTSS
ncbi:Flp family type IVb pilin [Effusibacillus dendaii]|uniref:Uncharacterized protein n=1 Tax=Effusibacillus dendaii TaxID=2743772 RepID=A0A7I8DGP8_9BACL|nr:hypothetical protein [Effusibacillus dendaii]BCJ88169.1 hypothetical protein skT53_31540 [Effusibacillus dendaii]